MVDRAPRLGDEVDDYCPRCRLLLNHDVTSLYDNKVAKATCRTCHNTHDYRNGEVPPKRRSKKNDKKALLDQVLATMPKPPEPPPAPPAPSRKKRDLWADVERIKGQKKD